MQRLILLRHGEAERQSAGGDDFDRRLAPRGIAESAAMGETLAEMGLIPDLAIISTSARTRGTWEAVSPAFPKAQARFDADLYLAEAEVVRRLANEAMTAAVLVIGHNPGLQELAVRLLVEGAAPPALIARVQRQFPTACAAVFLFDDAGRPHYDGFFLPKGG